MKKGLFLLVFLAMPLFADEKRAKEIDKEIEVLVQKHNQLNTEAQKQLAQIKEEILRLDGARRELRRKEKK